MTNQPAIVQVPVRSGTSRAGVSLIYIILVMTTITGMALLSVDGARAKMIHWELQTAADATARYASSYLPSGSATVTTAAINGAGVNKADGQTIVLTASDVSVGTWNTGTKTFTPGGATPNAVQVTVARTAAKGNAVPNFWGKCFNKGASDITVTAISYLQTTGTPVRVEGTGNLWLAGMANGTYGGAAVSGIAPDNSPSLAGVTLTPGTKLTFSVTGSTADDPLNINQNWNPDGQPGGLRTNDSGYLNGMADLNTQQGALVGVFLDNSSPTTGSTPAALDQSTQAAMDYVNLSPALKQPFFIGDGLTSGGTTQKVKVPAGATRLFLGTHDNINWQNNSGHFLVSIGGTAPLIKTVK